MRFCVIFVILLCCLCIEARTMVFGPNGFSISHKQGVEGEVRKVGHERSRVGPNWHDNLFWMCGLIFFPLLPNETLNFLWALNLSFPYVKLKICNFNFIVCVAQVTVNYVLIYFYLVAFYIWLGSAVVCICIKILYCLGPFGVNGLNFLNTMFLNQS